MGNNGNSGGGGGGGKGMMMMMCMVLVGCVCLAMLAAAAVLIYVNRDSLHAGTTPAAAGTTPGAGTTPDAAGTPPAAAGPPPGALVVTVFSDADFKGESTTYAAGDYGTMNSGKGWKSWGDRISSMKIPAGLKVTVYQHENFGGRKLDLAANDHQNLGWFAFGDNAENNLKDGQYAGHGRMCGRKFAGCWNDTVSSMKVMTA